jgi:phage shock protein C
MEKKLYKSNKNKMIDGVCGGIAEYFNVDPTLVRLATVALTCFVGGGLIAYIVCAIIVPRDPN